MNTLRKIQTGLAIALVSAFAFVAGPSAASATEELGEEASGAGDFSLDCTMSGATSTGREWAKLMRSYVKNGVVYCTRLRIGGAAPIEIPHCGERKAELGCHVILN